MKQRPKQRKIRAAKILFMKDTPFKPKVEPNKVKPPYSRAEKHKSKIKGDNDEMA